MISSKSAPIIWKDETLGAEYEVLPLEKLWDATFLESRPEIGTAVKASALTPEFYKEHRDKVVEYVAEHDDAMLTKYLGRAQTRASRTARFDSPLDDWS